MRVVTRIFNAKDSIIDHSSFSYDEGSTYSGLTATTIDDIAQWKIITKCILSDESILYLAQNPGNSIGCYRFFLNPSGFYYLGGESSREPFRVIVDPNNPSFLPLPLKSDREVNRTTREIVQFRRDKSDDLVIQSRREDIRGITAGFLEVQTGSEENVCALLREHRDISVHEVGPKEARSYTFSVLLDRYIGQDGLLHLEDLWYCERGGIRSMDKATAMEKAGPLFAIMEFDDVEWYRVDCHAMVGGNWLRYTTREDVDGR